jgi:hypothetical protein
VPNDGVSTYDVVFNGVVHSVLSIDTLKLNQNATIEKLTMSGGFLSGPDSGGPFTLTLNNSLNWSGGIIGGSSTTVLAKAGGSIAASSTCIVGTGTLDNQGTITYTATFSSTADNQLPLRLDSNGIIYNRAFATFNIAGDAGISTTSATAQFNNQGSFIKSAGTGVSVIGPAFNDTGTVQAQSGTLEFRGGASTHSGSVTASSGATLAFTSGLHTFNATSTLGGDGTLLFGGETVFNGTLGGGTGPLQIANGQTGFNAGSNISSLAQAVGSGGRALRLIGLGTTSFNTGNTVSIKDLASDNNFTPQANTSLTLTGADDLILSGPATWTGGLISGPQSGQISNLTVNAALSVSGAGMALDHRHLTNNSTITMSGGHFQMKNGSSIDNAANATFEIQNVPNLQWGPTMTGVALPSFNNAGLLLKSTGGETEIDDVRLVNTGTVHVQQGTLTFVHGETNAGFQGWTDTGVNSGVYQIDQGAKMIVGDHTMDAASTVKGAGTMEFRGNNNPVAGVYNITGQTNAVGGLAFLQGATVTNVGALLNIPGGVSFDTGASVTLHDVNVNGSLSGSDPITITGKLSGAGTISGNVTAPGNVSPGNSPGIMAVPGHLSLTQTTTTIMELGGNLNDSQATRYDSISASGAVTLDGNLVLTLVNGYVPVTADALTLVSTNNQLSGLFDNVTPGQRLTTSDGAGSFVINYGPGSAFGAGNVVASNFLAVPEPGMGLVVLAGVGLIGVRKRVVG